MPFEKYERTGKKKKNVAGKETMLTKPPISDILVSDVCIKLPCKKRLLHQATARPFISRVLAMSQKKKGRTVPIYEPQSRWFEKHLPQTKAPQTATTNRSALHRHLNKRTHSAHLRSPTGGWDCNPAICDKWHPNALG